VKRQIKKTIFKERINSEFIGEKTVKFISK